MKRIHQCKCGRAVVQDMGTYLHLRNVNDIRVSMTTLSARCSGCGACFIVNQPAVTHNLQPKQDFSGNVGMENAAG